MKNLCHKCKKTLIIFEDREGEVLKSSWSYCLECDNYREKCTRLIDDIKALFFERGKEN